MKGELTVAEQIRVLSTIWGSQKGFVFLPWINGNCKTKDERKDSYHEGRAYAWPKDRAAIVDHLNAHTNDDIYFTPGVFSGKRRIDSNLLPETRLWADLDPVDPSSLGDLRPTIAWESSPNRYQGVWVLDEPNDGAASAGRENHRLSLHIGADPSGWDRTQLLRVPGRRNHKPVYGEPQPGKLLWNNGPRYDWADFQDLPEVGIKTSDVEFEEEMLKAVSRTKVWSKVRLKVSAQVREYMAARNTGGADRSDVLWQIERDLADAGCSIAEIIAIIRPTVWNKYAGRPNELDQLKKEAQKAIAQKFPEVLEDPDDEPIDVDIKWLSQVSQEPVQRPRWLVQGIWTRGACGFIAGAPKSYKSWMALDMALTISSGTMFLGQPDYKCRGDGYPVLYLQEEDSAQIVMDRMANILEAKDPTLHYHGYLERDDHTGEIWYNPPRKQLPLAVHVQTGFIASDPQWQVWLEEKVREHHFAMVIIDTLGTTAGDVDTDRNSDLMNKVLKPLKQIAQMHDCAICIVHHNKKDDSNARAGRSMLGATALHAWVDCAIYARSKDADNVVHIERETKLANDLTLRIKIPNMIQYPKDHQERQLWEPEPVAPRVDGDVIQPDAQAQTASEPDHKPYVKGSHRDSALVSKITHLIETGQRFDTRTTLLSNEERKKLSSLMGTVFDNDSEGIIYRK